MSVSKIIRHFEGIAKIPVEVSAVHEQIKLRRPFEIIEIIGVDVPPTFVHGLIYKYKIPPIEGSMLTDKDKTIIPYSTQAHAYMQRLVACKELLHVLDPDPVLTSNMKQVWVLAEHMSNGKAIANPSAVTIDVLIDSITKYKAIAVLFPYGYREFCLENGQTDPVVIAERVELPVEYVKTVMSPLWPTFRSLLMVE